MTITSDARYCSTHQTKSLSLFRTARTLLSGGLFASAFRPTQADSTSFQNRESIRDIQGRCQGSPCQGNQRACHYISKHFLEGACMLNFVRLVFQVLNSHRERISRRSIPNSNVGTGIPAVCMFVRPNISEDSTIVYRGVIAEQTLAAMAGTGVRARFCHFSSNV